MSIYPNITEHDFINLFKLAHGQKDVTATQIKSIFMKQTCVKKLVENFEPITKKVEVDKSTENLEEVFEKTPQKATRNSKPILQNSQSQTLTFVSTSDELA